MRAVENILPDMIDFDNWVLCSRVVPPAQALAILIDENGFDFPGTIQMMNKVANYLH